MAAKKHYLSNIDEEARTAICKHCGPIGIHRFRGGWKCNPADTAAHREMRRQYTRRYRKRHPDRVKAANQRYVDDCNAQPRVLSEHFCECGCGEYTYIATNSNTRNQITKGQPLRYRHGHNPVYHKGQRIKQRYTEIDRGYCTPCWIWLLKINQWGYAVEGSRSAHRSYYEKYIGPIPDGYDVDHMCHQRSCVNPDHLQAVTRGENLWRMWLGRAGLTPIQITSLREWMTQTLTPEQIEAVWMPYVVD